MADKHITERTEVLLGLRGNPSDKAVTQAELELALQNNTSGGGAVVVDLTQAVQDEVEDQVNAGLSGISANLAQLQSELDAIDPIIAAAQAGAQDALTTVQNAEAILTQDYQQLAQDLADDLAAVQQSVADAQAARDEAIVAQGLSEDARDSADAVQTTVTELRNAVLGWHNSVEIWQAQVSENSNVAVAARSGALSSEQAAEAFRDEVVTLKAAVDAAQVAVGNALAATATARDESRGFRDEASASATIAEDAIVTVTTKTDEAVAAAAAVSKAETTFLTVAAASRPQTFDLDGALFSRNFTGPISDRNALQDVWAFVETEQGRAAQTSFDLTGNAFLVPRWYLRPTLGHTYRMTVRARVLGAVEPGTPLSIQFRLLGDDLSTTLATTTSGFSFAQDGQWVDCQKEWTHNGSTPTNNVAVFPYANAGYSAPGNKLQIVSVVFEDLTAQRTAEGFASLSETYSLDALAQADLAEQSAEGARNERLEAETQASNAASSATTAVNARNNAEQTLASVRDAETNVATLAQTVTESIGTMGPEIPRLPAETWTYDPRDDTALVRPAVAPVDLVVDDPEFGFAYLFPTNANRLLGPANPLPWSPDRVYEIDVAARVVTDDPAGDTQICLGASVYSGLVSISENQQGQIHYLSAASGVENLKVWITERDLSGLPSDQMEDLIQIATTGANYLYPHIRQNQNNQTDGIIAVGSFAVRDITSLVDAMFEATTAGVYRSDAAIAASDAEGHAASAEALLTLSASVSEQGAGVLSNPTLTEPNGWNWSIWTAPAVYSIAENSVYATGFDWTFAPQETESAGLLTNSNRPIWIGPKGADAYRVVVEFTLGAGSIDGAGVILDWHNTESGVFRDAVELPACDIQGTPGLVQTATAILKRPAGFTGTFDRHTLYAMANYSGSGFTQAAKTLTIHRVFLRVATPEELGGGVVGESVQATLTQNYYTIAEMDVAISNEVTSQVATIVGGTFEELTSQILTDYLTVSEIGSTIAAALTSFESTLVQPGGAINNLTAKLSNEYYTITQVEGAISGAVAGVENKLSGVAGSNYGAIEDILNLNVDSDSALLSSFTNLTASLDTVAGQVTQIADATGVNWQALLNSTSDISQGDAVVAANGDAALDQPGSIIVLENATSRSTGGTTNGAYVTVPADIAVKLSGQRVRIDVLARSRTVNAATAFSISYSTAENGNSGAMSTDLVDDDNWRWYSFYYDKPMTLLGNADYIGLFPDDAKANNGTDFARILVRAAATATEIPEIATLSGEIEHIRSLDLDATAGSAFATLMNQLEVDANGTSARVTEFQAAKADLDGFATAFAGVSVTTSNGFIAGFRASTFLTPAGGGAALELLGDVVAPGSLSTNRLLVGLGTNEIGDSRFASGVRDWLFVPVGVTGDETSLEVRQGGVSYTYGGHPVLQIRQAGVSADGYVDVQHRPVVKPDGTSARGVPVAPGAWYSASIRAHALRCAVELRIRWYDSNGDPLGFSDRSIASNTPPSIQAQQYNWPRPFVIAQAPARAAFGAIHIRKLPSISGISSFLFVAEPMFSETHADAQAPTPYAPPGGTVIDGDQILTGSITAEKANFASLGALGLVAGTADIEDGAITNAKIGDVIESMNFAQDAKGEPIKGWQIKKDGSAKFSDVVISRPLIIREGEIEVAGLRNLPGHAVEIVFGFIPVRGPEKEREYNPGWPSVAQEFSSRDAFQRAFYGLIPTGIMIPNTSVWKASQETLIATAAVMPAPDAYVWMDDDYTGNDTYWWCDAGIVPAARWNGDPNTGQQQIFIWISLNTYKVKAINGSPTSDNSTAPFKIEWSVKRVT